MPFLPDELLVTIPDVDGDSAEDAVRELEGLGLQPTIRRTGGLIDDFLIGAEARVCDNEPGAGERVESRTEITVETSKVC